MRGWDSFVNDLGFDSVEQMILPYARITKPLLQFEVIENREDGYVPSCQSYTLNLDIPLTSLPDRTFRHVLDRPTDVDKEIRHTVNLFFQDIDKAIMSSTLYTMTANERWKFLQDFEETEAHIPERFSRYSKLRIRVIRGHMQTERQGDVIPTSPSPPETPKEDEDMAPENDSPQPDNVLSTVVAPQPINNDFELSDAMGVLETEMGQITSLFDCSFRDLLETNTMLGIGPDIEGQVQLVLTDPPYTIRQERNAPNSEHDVLSADDMKDFVQVVFNLLRPGGHALLFCTQQ